MSPVVYEAPEPVPVAKDTLDPPRDFCATIVDAGIMNRDNPITSLVVEIAHPMVDDETEIEIDEEESTSDYLDRSPWKSDAPLPTEEEVYGDKISDIIDSIESEVNNEEQIITEKTEESDE